MGFFSSLFGLYNLEDSIKKISTCDEIIVKDLSDAEYLKLLGKKSSIIEKKTFHFPLCYTVVAAINFNYEGMAGIFDQQGWNKDMDYHNKIYRENKRLKERHQDHMMQYERSKQLYNNAKMNRNSIIANAQNGNKLLPYLLNPIGSPPKIPVLKLHKPPKVPKNKEEYTVYKKPMSGSLKTKSAQFRVFVTSFRNFDDFNSSHTLDKDYKKTFESLFNAFLKLQSKYLKKGKSRIESKFLSFKENVKLDFGGTEKDGTLPINLDKKDHAEIQNRTIGSKPEILDNIIVGTYKDQIYPALENGTSDDKSLKNILLKYVKVDVTKCSYSIPLTTPLSLQFIKYNDGKRDMVGVIDFMSKKLISLK